MDLSNKSLALLLVLAIVISLTGTMISLNKLNKMGFTGLATGSSTGTTNVTINSSIVLFLPVSNVNFGTGYVNNSVEGNCTIDTNGTNPGADADCLGFNTGVQPFQIRNDGNLNVTLNISSNATGAQFFGAGTYIGVGWYATQNESGSCDGTLIPATWVPVNSSTIACGSLKFGYVDNADLLNLHIRLNMSQDVGQGAHQLTITVTGSNP